MYEQMTKEYLLEEMLNDIPDSIPLYKGVGSDLYNMLAPCATQLAKFYTLFDSALAMAFIVNNEFELLDDRLEDFARYRKPGKKASGHVYFKGNTGARINNGDVITFNGLDFIVVQDIEIDTNMDNNKCAVEAIEIGAKYNLPEGVTFKMKNGDSITEIKEIINKESFSKGIDLESDDELYERFKFEMENSPTSGNEAHYIIWAKEVDGVYIAKSKENWNGGGTVKVLIMGKHGIPCSQEVISATKEHIETKRPVGAEVTVVTSKTKEVNVTANIKLAKGYSKEDAIEDIKDRLGQYMYTVGTEVVYNRILAIIATSFGVYDVQNLNINSQTKNIKLEADEVPNIEVNISEVSEV